MPDLGKYAFEVTLAYTGSIVLIAVLLGVSVIQARRAMARLKKAEGTSSDG